MQPDRCQKRQKVRNDVSLHRLCRYRGQNEEQTERGKQRERKRGREKGSMKNRVGDKQIQTEREDGDGGEHRKTEQV